MSKRNNKISQGINFTLHLKLVPTNAYSGTSVLK